MIYDLIFYILGITASLLLGYAFVYFLPGAKVKATITPYKVLKEYNATGCIFFGVTVAPSNGQVEKVNCIIKFPGALSDFKVDLMEQSMSDKEGNIQGVIYAIGKNENGECIIKGSNATRADIVVRKLGSSVASVDMSELNPGFYIQGMFTMSAQQPVFNIKNVSPRGSYRYTKFGVTINKRMGFKLLEAVEL